MNYTKKPIIIEEFTASQQITFFHQLKHNYFSGQIEIKDSRGREYTFYLYLGRIIYATGGIHRIRRWRRHILQYGPGLKVDNTSLSHDLKAIKSTEDDNLPWEYLLLEVWLREEKITREQLTRLICSLVSEIIFDLFQGGNVLCTLKENIKSLDLAMVIDIDQVIVEAWKMRQAWESANLDHCSPDSTPVLRMLEVQAWQAAMVNLKISPKTYQMMAQYFNGNYSIRDLAVKLNRGLVSLTKILMLYAKSGLIELKELPDLLPPELPLIEDTPQFKENSRKLLIGCVDDSPMLTGTLEKILKEAGHECVAVNDGLQAFGTFMENKPDLLFLDLIMSSTNGYELCAGFRKLSVFRQTPIILLTQNTNILDRMKMKISGFDDFLVKPINSGDVLKVVNQYQELLAS